MTWPTDASSGVKVLEDALSKDTSDGSDLSEITIKFSLDAEPRGDLDANGRQATDAVIVAIGAVDPLCSNSAAVTLMSSVVDASTKVSTEVQTFKTTWDVLLQRMERFNKIVVGIVQVFDAQRLADCGLLMV